MNIEVVIVGIVTPVIITGVTIYYKYYRNSKYKSVEIPEVIINSLTISQDSYKEASKKVEQLQIELTAEKSKNNLLNVNFYERIKIRVEEILINNQKSHGSELEKIIREILLEYGADIERWYKTLETTSEIQMLFDSEPFCSEIRKILLKIYLHNDSDDKLKTSASILWTLISEKISADLFINKKIISSDKLYLVHDVDKVIYFWNIINIGYARYGTISFEYAGIDFHNKFDSFFDDTYIGQLIPFLESSNPDVVMASSWSLVWLIDAKSELTPSRWKPNDEQNEIIVRAFSTTKSFQTIKCLARILNKLVDVKTVFRGNFGYHCAVAFDKNEPINMPKYEQINFSLIKNFYVKYISSSDETKIFLAKYLANYGYGDSNISHSLLTNNVLRTNDQFVIYTLLPYIYNVANDRGVISYIYEWISHSDIKIKIYGKLLLKSIETIGKKFIEELIDNKEAMATLEKNALVTETDVPNGNQLFLKRYIISNSLDCIHRIKAKDTTNRWAWYAVLVNPFEEHVFIEAIERRDGTIDLEEYGIVLASGYGTIFPDDLQSIVEES